MSLLPIARISSLILVVCVAFTSGALAQQPESEQASAEPSEPDTSRSRAEAKLPKDLDVTFGNMRLTESGEYVFTERVTLTWKESRIQADRVLVRPGEYVEAEGNVLIVWGGNRLFGNRLTYDLQKERGFVEDAVGEVNDEYIFWAKRAEKIGDDVIRIEKGVVTTCTQPVPYWSFAVTSARIRVDHYARMYNLRPRAMKVPFFYFPFLMWPVKPDRAVGLLLPEISSTDERGQAYSQQLFIPIGRSADVTLLGRYYSKAGFGGGGEFRFIPNPSGAGKLTGFYIFDQVAQGNVCSSWQENGGCGRYAVGYQQTQEFRNGFRMVADVNLVSDFNFFSDFSRNLDLVSTPTILTRVEFSRNGQWSSLNVRELRREQLLVGGRSLTQQTLPEIEWRGRSRKLGKTPFYLSYETSFASIQQNGQQQTLPIVADYFRGDLFPTLSLPISPRPWLDITPSLIGRLTYYTQQQNFMLSEDSGLPVTRDVLDDPLARRLWGAALSLIGPKAYRVFETGGASVIALKHTFEPRVSWSTWQNSIDAEEQENILVYDEVDLFSPTGDVVNYGLVQRLFVKRPRTQPEPRRVAPSQTILLPDGTTDRPTAQPAESVPEEGGAPPPTESVEIASLEIAQSRSLDSTRVLSRGDLDDDDELVVETTSQTSPIQIVGRYNPNPMTTVDFRTAYDILYDRFTGVTLSGTMRNRLARMRMSLVHRTGLGRQFRDGVIQPAEDDTQLRLTAGMTMLGGKMQLDVNGTVNFNPAAGQPKLPDRAWRMRYSNQCCTFVLERMVRQFAGLSDRNDWNFRVELKGVGKLLDVNY